MWLALTHSYARSHMRSTSLWCAPSANTPASSLPSGGPHGTSTTRRTTACSITACTSSSRSTATTPRTTVESSAVTRSALAGWASQPPNRPATPTRRSRSRTTCSDRKFVPTNSPRLSPSASLRVGMIAVCGIGIPSGCRNSAVTANQSASAPTMPASAAAFT